MSVRILSLNGSLRWCRLSPGSPEVTDDFNCVWPVAEFDVPADAVFAENPEPAATEVAPVRTRKSRAQG